MCFSTLCEKSAVVKEYKEEINKLSKEKDKIAKKLGEVIVERDWLEVKLSSLDLSIKKGLIDKDSEGVQANSKNPSLNRQLQLLNISKTGYYYKPVTPFSTKEDKILLNTIDKIHTKHLYYGTRRVVKLLNRLGFKIGRKLAKKAFLFMGIQAMYPKKKQQK